MSTDLKALMAPFPEDAIERTKGSVTRKGYDTTGVKYQYVVNRLNDVLGVGGWRFDATYDVTEHRTQKGRAMYAAECMLVLQLGEYRDGVFVVTAERSGPGGHDSLSRPDAKKGALTNALKKVAAMFGVGWQAYAGTLDDDHLPHPERQAEAVQREARAVGDKQAEFVHAFVQSWSHTLGRQAVADTVGVDLEKLDTWRPKDKDEIQAVDAALRAMERELDEATP